MPRTLLGLISHIGDEGCVHISFFRYLSPNSSGWKQFRHQWCWIYLAFAARSLLWIIRADMFSVFWSVVQQRQRVHFLLPSQKSDVMNRGVRFYAMFHFVDSHVASSQRLCICKVQFCGNQNLMHTHFHFPLKMEIFFIIWRHRLQKMISSE